MPTKYDINAKNEAQKGVMQPKGSHDLPRKLRKFSPEKVPFLVSASSHLKI